MEKNIQNKQLADILTHYEAEYMIERLEQTPVENYASPAWVKQDEALTKLNMQAHINAMMRADEYIMEGLVTFDKIKALIFDLLVTEAWKGHVMPLMKDHLVNLSSYRPYLSVYHEAVVLNLLEICLYHRTAVECADNYILELIDYCYRKLSTLLLKIHKNKKEAKTQKTLKDYESMTKVQEFDEQYETIEFGIAMMCLSIIRFITDHLKHLPLHVLHHLCVEADILCLLSPLIEERPWLRTNAKGEREIYENQKWNVVAKDEYGRLPKLEAQVWITIYNLHMDPECRKKYEINDFRKSNLLRLRKYMNEVLVDQIPVLTDLLRSLEELAIMNVNPYITNNTFIVQQMPELRNTIMKDKKWKEIAAYQKINYFQDDEKTRKEDFERMQRLYNTNILDGLMEGFKCANCQKEALRRCSKCKQEFYCSRECQVEHWKSHKKACQVPASNIQTPSNNVENVQEVSNAEDKPSFITEIGGSDNVGEKNKLVNEKVEANKENSNTLNELE